MRIGIVYHGAFPWNRGIGQLCELLIALGHEPVVMAPPGKPAGELTRGIALAPVPPTGEAAGLLGTSPANPRWRRWIEHYAREHGLGALFVRETNLSKWALAAARRLGVPVYLDMRENLAAMYAAGRARNPLLRVLRSRAFVGRFEARHVPRYDHVFTVSPELGEWATRQYALDPARVSVLANYPSDGFLELAEHAVATTTRPTGPPVLVYAGYVRRSRGIQDVLAALPLVLPRFPDVMVRVIGSGDYTETLKAAAREAGLERHVEFVDMLPPEALPAALAACHVGLSSYHLNEQTHQTVPGKLFEYMALGVPVLSSRRASVVRIVEETGCGVTYASPAPADVAAAIETLLAWPDELHAMGERGRRAVRDRYNGRRNLDTLAVVLGRGSKRASGAAAKTT